MNTASTPTPIPLDTFLADNALSVGLTQLDARTDGGLSGGVAARGTHWLVTLRCLPKRTSFTFQFTHSSAHKGHPSLRRLVDCVISDALADALAFEASRDPKLPALTSTSQSGEFAFETQYAAFCRDLGYDTDSRTAERAFRGCVRMWHGLKSLLSDEAFRQAMVGEVEGL